MRECYFKNQWGLLKPCTVVVPSILLDMFKSSKLIWLRELRSYFSPTYRPY